MKAQQGKIIGGTSCYGYDYSKEDQQLYVNPETSKIVKRIFGMYIEGMGTSKIAKALTKEGIITSTGKTTWNKEQ